MLQASASTSRAAVARPARRSCVRVQASLTAERATLDLSKMAPLNDRVLIKPIVEELKTSSGILLPSGPPKTNDDAHLGEVVAVGDNVELKLQKGDMVVYQKYSTAEVEVPEGEVIFVAQKSILATLAK